MPPSYEELAALVVEQAVLIDALRVELEALRRQVGRDSSNSSPQGLIGRRAGLRVSRVGSRCIVGAVWLR